jgi:hypothetical protein
MEAHAEKILELIFTGGTALAGLILVFLGALLTSFDGYGAEGQSAVRRKYQHRAWLALSGFVAALISATLALAGFCIPCMARFSLYGGLLALFVSFLMVLIVAIVAVKDLG